MKFQDALVDSPRSRAWRGALRELLDTEDLRQQLRVAKVRQRTSLRTLPKLTRAVDGTRKIIDDPPLIGHLDPETLSGPAIIEGYVQSLPDRRALLERYNVLDCARKVVGVASRHSLLPVLARGRRCPLAGAVACPRLRAAVCAQAWHRALCQYDVRMPIRADYPF